MGKVDQLQKQISKSIACLPHYFDIIYAVRQQFFLISENCVFLLLIPFQKLGTLITRHYVSPILIGVAKKAHTIQIFGGVK